VLKTGERIDELQRGGLRIIQGEGSFSFSVDSVLLAHFATLRPGDQVIDLGTGSGVIPLLMSTRARAAKLWGLELNPEAYDRALRSVALNQLNEQISIVPGDIRHVRDLFQVGGFDLVTTNPPYLQVGTGDLSPLDYRQMARHEVCCTLRDVLNAAQWLLRTGGRLALVHRPVRLSEIIRFASALRLEVKTMRMVHPKAGRDANMVLLEAVNNAKPGLVVGPPLIIHNPDGSYTDEVAELYAGGNL
jgi:tRNA1Val (adenine37-N6)-methyltransferase